MLTKEPPQLIYIAGYPRSGTTLLDRLLGASEEICGLGEAILAFEYIFSETARCACGKPFSECPVWSPVRAAFSAQASAPPPHMAQEEADRAFFEVNLLPLLFARFFPNALGAYQKFTSTFLNSIRQAVPESRALVDSSKSGFDAVWRPLALHRLAGCNVRVVHLIRDVRGVMASHHVRSNTSTERGELGGTTTPWFTGFHWLYVNWKVSLLRVLMPRGGYCAIEYETLVSAPGETLGHLATLLRLDDRDLPKRQDDHRVRGGGHQVYGNRMRFEPSLVLKRDETWRSVLTASQALTGRALMLLWHGWMKILTI